MSSDSPVKSSAGASETSVSADESSVPPVVLDFSDVSMEGLRDRHLGLNALVI
eukprot:CAMPEP_0117871140 /NCGR_PEP_ID=MMETSP0950-20121206/10323_1 /TAXON_ID=44440 /ORGANISM="Chattonella subsalsa, Strain CCMP2191" /LENGTH=52 /DNA_ID=CAMNT_0005723691 /DNA_START=202 /DNA_END=360 /DNA_ORIENTATION=+